MKRALALSLFGILALAACAPLNTYYKAGVPVATVKRDTTACEVSALRQVPVNTQVRREPPRFVPGRRVCDSGGNCRTYPGYYVPGEVYTYDANAGLRTRVERQCMADQGYMPVSIPACPDSVAKAAPPAATNVLPRLDENACVIRNRNGTFQIVNRG